MFIYDSPFPTHDRAPGILPDHGHYEWWPREATKLDCFVGRKKELLGIKLPRLSWEPGEGEREKQNGKKARRLYLTVGRLGI